MFAGGVNTAITNVQGVATAAVFTANSAAGQYTVTATVAGVAVPASFSMNNLAPVLQSLVIAPANPSI
jgi:copper chaperone CopZ